jgi:endogenous inhibitor of DNA gyrase (YacG/DUF329 family)
MIDTSCPICGRAMQGQGLAEWPQFPFCSPRCKTIDLGRWLGESYGIPAEEPEDGPPVEDTGAP